MFSQVSVHEERGVCLAPGPFWGGMPGPRSLPKGVYAWSQVRSGSMPDTRSLSGGYMPGLRSLLGRYTPSADIVVATGMFSCLFLHSSCNCIACNDNSYYQVIHVVSIYL